MPYMQAKFIKNLLLSVFIVSFAWSVASAADGAGSVLQQLEKTDKTYTFKEKGVPVLEKGSSQPAMENQQASTNVFVKKFRLAGNTLISEKELLDGVDLGTGKDLTLEEIKNVAEMITAKYRRKGYLIVNAYVPSQSIFDGAVIIKNKSGYHMVSAFGVVLIRVVEGKVAQISVTGNHHYSTPFIESFLEPVRQEPSLKEETLERALLLLNEYPSLSVKATLKAGTKFGTTDIIATVTDTYPLSATVAYDNYGVSATSKNRLSAALSVGNTITGGDVIKLNGIIGLDTIDPSRLSYGRAEYTIPVGVLGTNVGAYYSNTVYGIGGDDSLAALVINGKAHVAGLYVTHPVVKKLDETLTVRFGGEYVSLNDQLLGEIQDRDEIRKLSTGVSYEATDRFLGRNFINFGYARGLGALLGGTKNGVLNPGPSYVGADDAFNKFTLDAIRVQKLPGYNHLLVRGSFQYSPDRLFSAERLQLGGEGSVRGVNPGTASGDSGYFTSLELVLSPLYPERELFKQKVGDTVKLVLFADSGGVNNTSPRPSETTSSTISSLGTGLRLYGGSMFSCKLDWAIPNTHGFRLNDSHVYFQTMVSF